MRHAVLILSVSLIAAGAGTAGWVALGHRDPLLEARGLMQRHQLHGAQLVLNDLVRRHPERAEAHLRLAEVKLALGDPLAAEHELRAAGEHGTAEPVLRPLLAQALVQQGRNREVLQAYQADGLDPEASARLHIARGAAALALGQPQQARAEAIAAQQAAPRSAEAAVAAARVAQATGDLDAADRHVDEALAIDARSNAALVVRAQLLAQRGQRDAAIAAYGAAIATPSGAPSDMLAARLARAYLLIQAGRHDSARQDLDSALRAQARNPYANFLMAAVEAHDGHWKAADEALEQVGTTLDRFPRGDLLRAVVKDNVGRPQQALDSAERFHLHEPDNRTGALFLASLYLKQNRPAQATALLQNWNVAGRTGADVLSLLSQSYAMGGNPGTAAATLRQAMAPANPAGLVRIASIALNEGDPALAADALQAALDNRPAVVPVSLTGAAPRDTTPAPSQADTAATLVQTLLRAGQPDRAAAALDRLRRLHGDPERIDMLDGQVKLARFDLAGAHAAFDAAHRADPGSVRAVILLGEVLQLQGDSAGATALMVEARRAHPDDQALLDAYVGLALAQHAPAEAAAALEAAHRADQSDAHVATMLAELYLGTGAPAKALALAQGMPGDAIQRLALEAASQHALGHIDQAIADWHALLARVPQDLALRRRIVRTLIGLRRLDDAETVLDEGLAAHPDDTALQSDAVAVATDRSGLQAGLLRADTLAAQSRDPASRLLKGDLLLAEHRPAQAAAAFAAARDALPQQPSPRTGGSTSSGSPVTAAPDIAEILVLRQASALSASGDRAGSTKLLQDLQASHPDQPPVLLALAEQDLAAGALQSARSRFAALLKLQPENEVALNNIAWIERRQGNLDDARLHATLAYRLAPTPQVADTLGAVLLADGRSADALPLLRQAGDALPHDPEVQFHLAQALTKGGHADAARAVLKPVLEGGARFDERDAAERLMQSLGKS